MEQYLTADLLRAVGACEDAITRFSRIFPEGAEITEQNLMLAAERELDLHWIVEDMIALCGGR